MGHVAAGDAPGGAGGGAQGGTGGVCPSAGGRGRGRRGVRRLSLSCLCVCVYVCMRVLFGGWGLVRSTVYVYVGIEAPWRLRKNRTRIPPHTPHTHSLSLLHTPRHTHAQALLRGPELRRHRRADVHRRRLHRDAPVRVVVLRMGLGFPCARLCFSFPSVCGLFGHHTSYTPSTNCGWAVSPTDQPRTIPNPTQRNAAQYISLKTLPPTTNPNLKTQPRTINRVPQHNGHNPNPNPQPLTINRLPRHNGHHKSKTPNHLQ
jgi:hypothetical protein